MPGTGRLNQCLPKELIVLCCKSLCTGKALCTIQTPCAVLLSLILLREMPSRVPQAWHKRCPGDLWVSLKVFLCLVKGVLHQGHVADMRFCAPQLPSSGRRTAEGWPCADLVGAGLFFFACSRQCVDTRAVGWPA